MSLFGECGYNASGRMAVAVTSKTARHRSMLPRLIEKILNVPDNGYSICADQFGHTRGHTFRSLRCFSQHENGDAQPGSLLLQATGIG